MNMKRMMQRYGWLAGSLAAAALVLTAVARADTDSSGNSPPATSSDTSNAPAMAPAQPGSSDASSAPGQARVSGRIVAIDLTGHTIAVKGLFLKKVVTLDPNSQIAIEGKTGATLADLKVGDRVDVSYHMDGNSATADRITRTGTEQSENSGPEGSQDRGSGDSK